MLVEIIRKYTFDLMPIHRYKGRLTLEDDILHIDMQHIKSSSPLCLDVPLRSIVALDFGFDNVFCFFMDQSWFGPHMKPLYISYTGEDSATTAFYVFAEFDHGLNVYRRSKNRELFEIMSNRIATLKTIED